MFQLEREFYCLVEALNNNQFSTEVDNISCYLGASNNHDKFENIRYGFCTQVGLSVYDEVNGKFSAYLGKFAYWKNCFITVPLPNNNKQIDFILKELFFWRYKSEQYYEDHKELRVKNYSSQKSFYDLK